EDGIRDRSVSRGLGDVYKRQDLSSQESQRDIFDRLFQFRLVHLILLLLLKNNLTQQKVHNTFILDSRMLPAIV
ncbi:hypothetical protein, partial [Staphylococcus aureus]